MDALIAFMVAALVAGATVKLHNALQRRLSHKRLMGRVA